MGGKHALLSLAPAPLFATSRGKARRFSKINKVFLDKAAQDEELIKEVSFRFV
jgi:hypothetical protein